MTDFARLTFLAIIASSGPLHKTYRALQVVKAAKKLPHHRSHHRPELTPEVV